MHAHTRSPKATALAPPCPTRRAAKFGNEYVEPSRVRKDMALEARKERNKREGFATGIDVWCEVSGGLRCWCG